MPRLFYSLCRAAILRQRASAMPANTCYAVAHKMIPLRLGRGLMDTRS